MPEQQQGPAAAPPRIAVFADFVCPWSYIAQGEIDRLAGDYGVEPDWRPHWLHPETPPEGMPRPATVDPKRGQATHEWLKELSPEMAGRMTFPGKVQYSFLAFEALEFARDHGRAHPFRQAVYDALWVEGKDIGQAATLQDAAERAGLDAGELGRALHDRTYADRALQAVNTAHDLGITQTPTIILGRTAVLGWHYYEALQTVLEQQGLLPSAGRV